MQKNHPIRLLTGALAAAFLLAALLHPETVRDGAISGLLLWYRAVLPVQFPFVIATRMLLRIGLAEHIGPRMENLLRRLFHLPGEAGAIWLTGWLAGYPNGAFGVGCAYEAGRLRRDDLLAVVLLSNTAGPLFVVGTLGTLLLQDAALGWKLLLIHWLGAMITAVCFRPAFQSTAPREKRADFSGTTDVGDILSEAVQEAAEVVLRVGEYIVLFSVILALLPFPSWHGWEGLLLGGLEVTAGALRLCGITTAGQESMMMALSFLLGFSGLSVLAQTVSVLGKSPLSRRKYIVAKLVQGLVSAGLSALLALVL